MFLYSFGKRPLIENSQSVSSSVFIRNYCLEHKQHEEADRRMNFDLNNEYSVKELIWKIEKYQTINIIQKNNDTTEFSEPNKVKLTYTISNLGKGFVFWFICNICGKKVRYLYFPPHTSVSACRTCHRLAYKVQNKSRPFRFA